MPRRNDADFKRVLDSISGDLPPELFSHALELYSAGYDAGVRASQDDWRVTVLEEIRRDHAIALAEKSSSTMRFQLVALSILLFVALAAPAVLYALLR